MFSSTLSAQATNNIRVIATIKPFYNLAAAITDGTNNKPLLLLSGNISPHDYALKVRDVEAVTKADLIIWGGDGLEIFLTKLLKNPELANKLFTIQDLKNLEKLSIRNKKTEHLDEHLWLSPVNAEVIAVALTQKLIKLDPINANKYRHNKQKFLLKLAKTSLTIKEKLNKLTNKKYLVFHDAYQYFEKFYGLPKPLVISDSPEMPLSVQRMLVIHKAIQKHQIKCLFKEPQFNSKILDSMLQANDTKNLQVGMLDPIGLDHDLGSDGYFKLLNNLADELSGCLSSQ